MVENETKQQNIDLQLERLKFEQERFDFKQEKSKETFFNKYISPSITHIVTIFSVLITGYLGLQSLQKQHLQSLQLMKEQSEIEAQKRVEHELWKVKYEAYQEALDLVAKYFYSLEWNSGQIKHQFPASPPKSEDYGRIYGRLRLLTNHPKLLHAFLTCLGAEGQDDGTVKKYKSKPIDIDTLVKIMREDLGAKGDPTPAKDFALIDFLPRSSTGK